MFFCTPSSIGAFDGSVHPAMLRSKTLSHGRCSSRPVAPTHLESRPSVRSGLVSSGLMWSARFGVLQPLELLFVVASWTSCSAPPNLGGNGCFRDCETAANPSPRWVLSPVGLSISVCWSEASCQLKVCIPSYGFLSCHILRSCILPAQPPGARI